ncbi:MAG: metallophosphoesterase family protein [Candidatus Methylacidiphilales bacterium]|nr:metallophosphoesterase family protein [Candidatus Methylacidiphilales bacterium]
MNALKAWLSGLIAGKDPGPAAPRLHAAQRPPLLYAIGDVHGCLTELKALEARIVADAASEPGEKWLVMLGDYVDRGPHSAQVIDHLLAPPPKGFKRICLRGNHEAAMLGALDGAGLETWLGWGVESTLASYGLGAAQIALLSGPGRLSAKQQTLAAYIPDEHATFLRELPTMLTVPGYIFVHAGLRPGVPLAAQRDNDLLWIRGDFLDTDHDFGAVIVHGHTPADEPFLSAYRIGLDTGCFASGRLTGLRVDGDGAWVV